MIYVKFDKIVVGFHLDSYIKWGENYGVDVTNEVFQVERQGRSIPVLCSDGQTRPLNGCLFKTTVLNTPLKDYL